MMAQAMNETKSTDTDKLIAYFEKETEFDILKARKAHFRSWDHQLMQEAYPFTVKPKGQAKDKWDLITLGAAVPGCRTSRSKFWRRRKNRIPARCNPRQRGTRVLAGCAAADR